MSNTFTHTHSHIHALTQPVAFNAVALTRRQGKTASFAAFPRTGITRCARQGTRGAFQTGAGVKIRSVLVKRHFSRKWNKSDMESN